MTVDSRYFSSRTEDTSLLWKQLQRQTSENGLHGKVSERIEKCLNIRFGKEPAEYVDQLQRPEFYIPGLRTQAWYDPAEFPWLAALERAHPRIAAECIELAKAGVLEKRPEGRGGRWATSHLYFLGGKSEELCARCPETSRLIEQTPGATSAGLVYFASLAPGTHLEPHCGPTNARLRCHLGVRIPEGCSIRVGAETRQWTEGKCLVFDDSFEHQVWHVGTTVRLVLVLDIWHPDLTPEETRAISGLMRAAAARPGGQANAH
ncbi:MAG TPA: aspartyl/asparaginyl beta-hydroxylase domain-containing protein [Candidatus Dormibacteraeota bacterium]|nr:aspartyl/asparaginyl beta-hydroxylase domain-containing protein [Candidatus Dormibacteraeota bacterium]